jgi:hypothetical protein
VRERQTHAPAHVEQEISHGRSHTTRNIPERRDRNGPAQLC